MRAVAAVSLVVIVTLASACGSSPEPTGAPSRSPSGSGSVGTTPSGAPITFADVDAAFTKRVSDDDLDGAATVTRRDGVELHRKTYGAYGGDTIMSIASASKWLTSAVVMTLVDEGKLDLDAPVSTYLPEWGGEKQGVTLRLLMSHHAGLSGSASCLGDSDISLRDCAAEIGKASLAYPIGTEFHYGNAGFTVAAAAAEAVTGMPFATLFEQRITTPLGMTNTWFPVTRTSALRDPSAPHELNRNPFAAAGAVSTLDDFDRFVAMMAHDGRAPDGRQILSATAIGEIEADQVKGLDTHADGAVQITDIPTYGLGVWRDRVSADDTAQQISGSGSVGFYPWIDRARRAWGVIAVDDGRHGAEHAVPASARILHELILPAVDNAG